MSKAFQAMTLALGVSIALAIAGCDSKTQDNLKEKAAEAQQQAGQVAGDAMAKAKEGWESLKSEYAPQIEQLGDKVATLKTEAAKFKDTQLDGYISELEGKLGAIQTKLGEAFSADGMASLKDNLAKWTGEAKELYDKAAARVAELAKGAGAGAAGVTGG
jgi:hypothetical protein